MPTATREPRIRMLLKLLRSRAGQWIPGAEIADIGGPMFSVYISELRSQGHLIRERREWHGTTRLFWFRLESSARFSAPRAGLALRDVRVEE